MSKEPRFSIEIKRCARCGEDHLSVTFFSFDRPPTDVDNIAWSHWGICPKSNDPILMRQVKDDAPLQNP